MPHAEALQAARAFHRDGRVQEALRAYQALTDDPAAPPALRAEALHATAVIRAPHAPEDAVALLRAALALQPKLPQAADHLGTLLAALGRAPEAIAIWRTALADTPADADLWRRLAALLRTTGQPTEAVAAARHAQGAAPEDAAIRLEMGRALLAAGKAETAVATLLRARALNPGLPGIAATLGAALLARGNAADALPSLHAALAEHADDRASAHALARALLLLHQPEPATAALRRALALHPGDPGLLTLLARTLLAQSRAAAALSTLRPLLAHRSPPAEALLVAGHALRALGRPAEALARLTAAIAQSPGDPEARHAAALARLTQGDFAGGWPGFALRLHADPRPPTETRLRQPGWNGDAPLAGRRILLYAEPSLEDTLHFLRYVPMVAGLGARVLLRVQPALHHLVAAMPALAQNPDIVLDDPGASRAQFDLRCALADLPAAFGTTLPTIPAVTPYLAPPPELAERWQEVLPPPSPRIAIAWAGAATSHGMPGSTLSPATLGALLDALTAALPSVRLHALGPPDPAAEPVLDRFADLLDLRPNTPDAGNLAAALARMDLVIAADGPILHLAGALARPCFALLPNAADWRWLVGRRDSPWYPSMRLFRGDLDATEIARQARQAFFL